MKPVELKQILHQLGLGREEFGRLLAVPPRTAYHWCSERTLHKDKFVPPTVGVIAHLLQRRPELVEVLREMAAEREAKLARKGKK
jgi:hypothetical protein